ncbi:MAG: DUF167 domain-containing protein [Chloroflexota bacterium]|nr:DUF167 domain-containing protein [Chloroflexota bacterium]
MIQRDFRLHNGKKGTALGIRVIPRAKQNEIVEILNDGTIRVRLKTSVNEAEMNRVLSEFLAQVLGISVSKIEVVAGQSGRDKLVSILDMGKQETQQKIVEIL